MAFKAINDIYMDSIIDSYGDRARVKEALVDKLIDAGELLEAAVVFQDLIEIGSFEVRIETEFAAITNTTRIGIILHPKSKPFIKNYENEKEHISGVIPDRFTQNTDAVAQLLGDMLNKILQKYRLIRR